MKNLKACILLCLLLPLSLTLRAQTAGVVETEAKGTGLKREDALQDALRNAIGQAVGVAMNSETRVENYMVVSDAIASRTTGYIKTYQVIKETPFPDRYELSLKASVTTEAMKADFGMLAKAVGGVRFMVVYDPRNIPAEQLPNYDLAIDKMNEYLSSKTYRYIERQRFESLRTEAIRMLEADQSEISYVQQLGLLSGAQFIINLSNLSVNSRSEQFDTRTSSTVSMQAKAYDNCTAEGLGTLVFESGRSSSSDAANTIRSGIAEAVNKNADQLLGRFVSYIGEWVNNGTPFELRFYNAGTYRDFRDLKAKMKELPQFGGEMEIVAVENYTKLNCTFKKKPDELADKVLDIADEIPGLKEKVLDVKLIYGRQINFAPRGVKVPELEQAGNNLNGNSQGSEPVQKEQSVNNSESKAGSSNSEKTPVQAAANKVKAGSKPKTNSKTKGKTSLKPVTK